MYERQSHIIRKKTYRLLERIVVFVLIVSWLFSGWPRVTFQIGERTYDVPPAPKTANAAWYNASWQYRKSVTLLASGVTGDKIATTTTVGSANFPTLVDLTDSNLASSGLDDCSDVLFTQSNGTTKLNHEIESCNPTTGQITAWVNTAMSSSIDTIIYMYYGGYGDQQNISSTWDSVYKGVWHLWENPADLPGPQILDSTNNNQDGTATPRRKPFNRDIECCRQDRRWNQVRRIAGVGAIY